MVSQKLYFKTRALVLKSKFYRKKRLIRKKFSMDNSLLTGSFIDWVIEESNCNPLLADDRVRLHANC